ncbi:MAG: ABC transporter substrate-binding protein [Deinococcus sp.]|nr:ABC transporter substrate-binding protein [Deinococcus sp.]
MTIKGSKWWGAAIALVLLVATGSLGQGQTLPRESTLVAATSFDIKTLDPGRAFEIASNIANKVLYNTLVTLPSDQLAPVIPDLAESWTISSDGLTYTFTLREGVTFHSGNALHAADVAWSYQRLIGIQGNPSFLAGTIASIEASDDRTVVITLTAPDPAILTKLTNSAFSVLDSATVQANGGTTDQSDQAEEFLNTTSAGTGSYTLEAVERGNEIRLRRNPNYFRGPAPLEGFILRIIPQAATQKLTLEAGDIDIALDLSADQAASLRQNPQVRVVEAPSLNVFFLLLNQDPALGGPLSNDLVRQAVRQALDYEGLRSLSSLGAVSPPSVIPIGLAGALPVERAYVQNQDQARALLAQAGYASGFDTVLEYPTAFSFSGLDFDAMAQKVQADLAEVGINVTLRPTEFTTALAQYRAAENGFTLWFWAPDFLDALDYIPFLPGELLGRRARWAEEHDPELTQLKAQVQVEVNDPNRAELFGRIQEILQVRGPWVPFIQPGIQIGVRASVQGYVYNPLWTLDAYTVTGL